MTEASKARLEATLLSMGDGVLVVDASGAPVLSNEAYTRYFGDPALPFAADDQAGDAIAPEATPQQRAARGEAFVMEFGQTAPDGSHRYYEASGQPIHGAPGETHGGVITIRDITDRSLFRLQNEFMAQVGHELRTPLTSQYTVLQLLKRRLPSQTSDDQSTHYVDLALEAARRMRTLVEDLMDMARLRSGKFTLQLQAVDVVALARRAVENAQAIARGQTIALDAPARPLLVRGDPTRLEQVLMNLLTNAIKYAPGTERIEVRLRRMHGMAEVQVRDSGIGIAAKDVPLIFTRLFQSASASRDTSGGLGLGLYLTKELVEAHDGSITVESDEGKGSTFTVRLPLAPAER